MPHHEAFYIQGAEVPISCYGTWSGSISIALQELQAVGLMLCRMAFQLSNEVVALHLNNNTVNAYSCNQGSRDSLFLSRLACHIFNLANKCGITLIPAYAPTHLKVEANYISVGQLVPEWHPAYSHGSGCISS